MWDKGYDLFEPMLEPAPKEMDVDELAQWMRVRMALGMALAAQNGESPLRARTDLSAPHRRFAETVSHTMRNGEGEHGLFTAPLVPDGPTYSPDAVLTIAQMGVLQPERADAL